MLIKKLVECVSKNGNLLLNIGPDAKGNVPTESLEILKNIAAWMKQNGESIYGCGNADMPKPDYGRITRKANTLYYHIMEPQIGGIPLVGIKKEQVKQIRHVATGAEMRPFESWFVCPDCVNIRFGESPQLPNPINTVVAVELFE
jgi:alpha-L-fucosidase